MKDDLFLYQIDEQYSKYAVMKQHRRQETLRYINLFTVIKSLAYCNATDEYVNYPYYRPNPLTILQSALTIKIK